MSTITEKQRYEIETNAAAFLHLRDEIEKTPVGPDFIQMSGKYKGSYASMTVVENSYSHNGRSLLSITTSNESDPNTLFAMGHYLNRFLEAHGIAPPRGEYLAGKSKLGQDFVNQHTYYEVDIKAADFARAKQLTHDLLVTGDIGLTPEQVAGTCLISKAEYETTLPPGERNKPRIPHNTQEREAWFATIKWPPEPAPVQPIVEASAVSEPAAGEQPGAVRKFLRQFGFKG